MAAYTQQGYGPPKPNTTPKNKYILDRFGMALAEGYTAAGDYSDSIPGLPVSMNPGASTNTGNITIIRAREALLGDASPDDYTGTTSATLHSIGARIIHLAQCVREAGLCAEYLEYTTLPLDNKSGLFDVVLVAGQSRYVGDIKAIYDKTVLSLPYTSRMFSEEDRDQYDNNPLIPFRLAYYIKAFMDEFYKVG